MTQEKRYTLGALVWYVVLTFIFTALLLSSISFITIVSTEELVLNYIVFALGAISTLLAFIALVIAFFEVKEGQKFNSSLENNINKLDEKVKNLDSNSKEIGEITRRIDVQNFYKAEDLINQFKEFSKENSSNIENIKNEDIENLTKLFLDFYKGYNDLPEDADNNKMNEENGSTQVRNYIYSKINTNDIFTRKSLRDNFANNPNVTDGMISGVIYKMINSKEIENHEKGTGTYKKLI
ncbi:hypothetical protein [Salinicoccus roseus]|uniref:hypothetical protein n=1 Tax=Salinicoccus roseus TaxID=45670 RepID=UPI000F513EAD|nr:hypothetical protein [Salinicoccus roseus]RPE54759.1 hypothetical protein EDC33_1020 [Salinicoccus roseus]GGA62829.1 hypothetical protein GCM10007176_04120 [Salinicoccus roseus]